MFLRKLQAPIAICIIATLSASLLIGSCKKKNDNEPDVVAEKTGYANDQLILEHVYNNVDRVVDRAFTIGASALKGGENPLASCASVTIDSSSEPWHLIIDFGKNDCLGFDGRYRKGKVIVAYDHNKKRNQEGYVEVISYENYRVDNFNVLGFKRVTNKGLNDAGNMHYEVVREDKVELPDNGGVIQGVATREMIMIKGAKTPQNSDDVYSLTGSGKFSRPDRSEYTIDIADPLILPVSCNWITQGVINIYPNDATQRVLDYGDGGCENDATINVNGVVRTVLVP